MAGNYGDPSREKLSNGRSMSDLMRRGPGGLRGVVVSPATPGGLPENFNPHDRANLQVNIVNPDGSSSQSLSLNQMTREATEQALQIAAERVPGNDINSIRERSAVAFEELARIASSGVKRVPIKQAKATQVIPQPAEDELLAELASAVLPAGTAAVPVDQIDRNYSPMAAFGLKKNATAPVQNVVMPSTQRTIAPQKLVYFEKEGLGTVPAFYHDVIVQVSRDDPDNYEYSGFMVLIYDLRFEQNAARWFPPANDPYQRPWAALIKGDQRLYLVHTTGFQYVYDNREYCVLKVERAVIAPATEAADEEV